MPLLNTMSANNSNELKTFEIFASFLLVAFCLKLTSSVIYAEVVSKKLFEAQQSMSTLALQMDFVRPVFVESLPGRSLASVGSSRGVMARAFKSEGEIGQDPWGRPYYYKFFPASGKSPGFLVLISGGPNGQVETDLSSLDLSQTNHGKLNLSADDLGFIRSADGFNNL